jgi:transcriptional regulator with XRE-family HTH domain
MYVYKQQKRGELMKERLKELRIALGISQAELGERIGVSRAAISRLESGSNNFTNQMVTSICREFGVNEEWLRTGSGDMFEEMSRAEKAAQIVGAALGSGDEFILNTFIALGQLSPAEWELIKKFVDKIKGDDEKSS